MMVLVLTGCGGSGQFPSAPTVNLTNRTLVTNNGGNTLSVIDNSSNTVVSTIIVGIGPQAVAVNTSAHRAYVTNNGSNTLSVIDTGTNTVVATVTMGTGVGPRGVAVLP